MANVVAVIPARSGSKGVVDKNIKLLAGHPLIAYSIAAAQLANSIDRIIVSTDSTEYAGIAREYGAEVPFLRPDEISSDNSTDYDFVRHLLDWMIDNEGTTPEYLVHLRPTTPVRDPVIVDSAVTTLIENVEATSLRSGHPASESPFKWFLLGNSGYFMSIHPDYSNEFINKPRQSFPMVYIPDGYVDILKTSYILETGMLHGEKMLGFVSPVCREVDTIEDFEYIEFELVQKGSPLLDYMKKKYPAEA